MFCSVCSIGDISDCICFTKEKDSLVEENKAKNRLLIDADMSKSDNYYVVYGWGTGVEPFASLDLRGH